MKNISLSISLSFCLVTTFSCCPQAGADKKLPQNLINALLVGDLQQVKAITSGGKYIDGQDETGRSAIMLATLGDNLEVVRYLGGQGADLYAKDNFEQTVLDKAVRMSSLPLVRYFVDERKMNVHAVEDKTKDLLYTATANFHVEVIQYLIEEKGLSFDSKNRQQETLLHEAANNGNLEVMKYLVEAQKMAVNEKDEQGRTPLHKAAEKGYVKLVDYLVGVGADLSLKDHKGMTALKIAQKYDRAQVVDYLRREMSLLGRMTRFFKSTLGQKVVLFTTLATAYLVYRLKFAK
ncbi:MAG: ankyrin repeat domain-containing protein [Bacteroidota bacterium]